MPTNGTFGSAPATRRHFLKDFFGKVLATAPVFRWIRWPKQIPITGATHMSKEPSAAQQAMGDFAPKFVELTDKVLFGDVWERKELSKRDRSLATVAALVALNRTDQLRFHLQRALENGVKKQELIEEITHLAFYSGWPTAVNALGVAKEVFSKT
jgi:4-carboxymuconolactone decarboxylase